MFASSLFAVPNIGAMSTGTWKQNINKGVNAANLNENEYSKISAQLKLGAPWDSGHK
jgi:hypothetical protein